MPNLFVVIDPEEEIHTGLERCKELAPNADLAIHVCSFVQADVARDFANNLAERKRQLERIVEPFKEIGYNLTHEVVPFTRLHEKIIERALITEADFILKPMRQHSLARRIIMSSTDWNLVRLCPLPLYLVNGAVNVHGKSVLAAIDVENPDDEHAQLNEIVMQQATAVARVLGGAVQCVNSWHVSTTVMAGGGGDSLPYEIGRDMQIDHIKKAKAFATAHGLPESAVSVGEGTPQFVVQEVAKELDAGVVVIGTVARTGISGLFIGNTAEAMLEGSTTDVLVVKAPDFECPI